MTGESFGKKCLISKPDPIFRNLILDNKLSFERIYELG